jgi:hypothetical protein
MPASTDVTDEITRAWADKSVKEYKNHKQGSSPVIMNID